jgi:magnesium-transporting ATPase (P-type)
VSSYESEDFLDLDEIKHGQIWIGLVGLRHQPRPMAPLFVEQLDHSHVRFVYFSDENEQRSKVFADKLGLETGWNSFITLKDVPKEEDSEASKEEHIQKLPVGVSNIRDHLRDIDNVPLLVRLFVDATPENKAEMLKIAEEEGEVTFVMGTVADPDNFQAFMQAPMAFGLLPGDVENSDAAATTGDESDSETSSDDFDEDSSTSSHHRAQRNNKKKLSHGSDSDARQKHKEALESAATFLENEISTRSLVTDLLRLTCHFMSHKSQAFVDILELLIMGRRLEQQTLMFAWLFFLSFAALNFHQLLSSILFVVMTLTGIQLYYIGFIIIPIMSLSHLWNPRPSGLSSMISEKNTSKHTSRIIRYGCYGIARTLPFVLVCLTLFVWTLWFTWTPFNSPPGPDAPSKLEYIFGATHGISGWNPYKDKAFQDALSFSQNVSLFALTLYIVTASASCLHRTNSLLTISPLQNVPWIFSAISCIILAVAFFVISEHKRLSLFTHIHPYMYILLFGWVPCQVLLDEFVKKNTRAHFTRTQDILKLDYNTKLGMYSPI